MQKRILLSNFNHDFIKFKKCIYINNESYKHTANIQWQESLFSYFMLKIVMAVKTYLIVKLRMNNSEVFNLNLIIINGRNLIYLRNISPGASQKDWFYNSTQDKSVKKEIMIKKYILMFTLAYSSEGTKVGKQPSQGLWN